MNPPVEGNQEPHARSPEMIRSRCNWFYILSGLIAVVALVLIATHRADNVIHMNSSGDDEPGSRKFDHLELFNVSSGEALDITIRLLDDGGGDIYNSPYPVASLAEGNSQLWVVLQDGMGVKKAVLEYRRVVEDVTWIRTCVIEAYPDYYIRSATFWRGDPPGPGTPTFWGQALTVPDVAMGTNIVVPSQEVLDQPE